MISILIQDKAKEFFEERYNTCEVIANLKLFLDTIGIKYGLSNSTNLLLVVSFYETPPDYASFLKFKFLAFPGAQVHETTFQIDECDSLVDWKSLFDLIDQFGLEFVELLQNVSTISELKDFCDHHKVLLV